jgi:alpha-1,6-mannosyltransferase
VVWAAIGLLVLLFALTPPLLSHDVYSYIAYARLGASHGLDPYVATPRAIPLDTVFDQVDWKGVTSAYGPLFTLATYPLAGLSVGSSILILKLSVAAAALGLVAVVARLAPSRGVEPVRAAAFVGLNPLLLVHVVGGPHNDGVAMLLAMLAVAATLGAAEASGGAAFVLAAGVKATGAFALPFALLGTGVRRRRLLLGAAAAFALMALVAWPAFGLDWLGSLNVAGDNLGKTSHMSVPITFSRIAGVDSGLVQNAALYIYGGLVAYLLIWTWRGGDWVRAAGWAGAGLLLASTWLLPWYLIWALPFAAISRDRPLQLLVLALTAFQLGTRIPL